jgi:GTP-dependent phosphoenolpyruvate carboxykinase
MKINELKHARLKKWVEDFATLTQPDDVVVCDGSAKQYDELADLMVADGLATRLSETKKPIAFCSALILLMSPVSRNGRLSLQRSRKMLVRPTTGLTPSN